MMASIKFYFQHTVQCNGMTTHALKMLFYLLQIEQTIATSDIERYVLGQGG